MISRRYSKYWLYAILMTFVVAIVVGRWSYLDDQEKIDKIIIENLALNHQLSISRIKGNMEALNEEVSLLAKNKMVIEYAAGKTSSQGVSLNKKGDFEDWAMYCVEHFEFYDLFLITAQGEVVYSVAKEEDLGTNMIDGPFSSSGLGKLFQSIKQNRKLAVADFSVYEPSNNMLAGFIGAPILNGEELVGVLAIQLSTSFEKLNIGVHIEDIKDFVITSDYVFQHKGTFQSLDSINYRIPTGTNITKQNDSLSLYTPFVLNNLNWGILSVAPPEVFIRNVAWDRITYFIFLSVLVSFLASVIIINHLTHKKRNIVYTENDIVLVQNTWHQFMKTEHSFGKDFYFRAKEKIDFKLAAENSDLDKLGKEIEQFIGEMVLLLNNQKALTERIAFFARKCIELNYPAAKLSKLPDVFIESFEDERGHEIPLRARVAWAKITKSLVYNLIGFIKNKT